MEIYTIYKATNTVNGKSYIGFDSHWPHRKYTHKSSSKTKTNTLFRRAIRKYGIEVFNWEILYQSNDYDYTRNIAEEYFIRLHQTHGSLGKGYNATFGGEGEKGNRSRSGMPHTESTKRLCSKNRIGICLGDKNPMKRPENREKLRVAKTGRRKVQNQDGSFSYKHLDNPSLM